MFATRPTVLVIHAERAAREAIAAILQDAGFDVVAAENTETALRRIAGATIDLGIIAAASAGVGEGPDAAALLRRRHPGLKIVLLAPPAAGLWAAAGDCDEVMAAPVDQRRLLGCVYELLLRDRDHATRLRHRYAAEFGIAAARVACLENRRAAADQDGEERLARDLDLQIAAAREMQQELSGATAPTYRHAAGVAFRLVTVAHRA